MYRKFFKRALDIIFSITLLPLVVIIVLLVGIFIWLEDKGPALYNSMRLGKNGKVFLMYKLRTMKVNSPDIRNEDGSTYNSPTDSRHTRIGKFLRMTSLDELPQVINVLKGDMSFIGPRPDLPEHIKLYSRAELPKLSVLPGLTGYNQAFFRNSLSWDSRLQNDVFYAENVSFLLDFRILLLTIRIIVLQKGVFSG